MEQQLGSIPGTEQKRKEDLSEEEAVLDLRDKKPKSITDCIFSFFCCRGGRKPAIDHAHLLTEHQKPGAGTGTAHDVDPKKFEQL